MGTIVCDLDGVLAEITRYDRYHLAKACASNIAVLRGLVDQGHTVVLHTSRLEVDREVTEQWLRHNEVPYSALFMEKPLGDVYIDDKAVRMAIGESSEGYAEEIGRLLYV